MIVGGIFALQHVSRTHTSQGEHDNIRRRRELSVVVDERVRPNFHCLLASCRSSLTGIIMSYDPEAEGNYIL